ncbi:MAG: molybdopterin-dependent oxidoreductase [Planctomycetota bacterium]
MGQRLTYCRLCEAGCGAIVTLDALGKPLSVEPDRDHVVTKGFFCTKGSALVELVNDPARLVEPMERSSKSKPGLFIKSDWNRALDEIATKITNIAREHGPDAIAFYQGNPVAFSWSAAVSTAALARVIGTGRFYTAGTIDCAQRFVLSDLCYGHPLLVTIPDLDNTQFALLLGGNPAVSTWAHLTSIPRWRESVAALKKRGGKFVVIDPRRTETADAADLYLTIRPGSDADLLLAMVNVILSEGLSNERFLSEKTYQIEEARRAIREYTVPRAAARTGIAETVISNLARDFARAESSFAAGHSGLTMQSRGSLAEWAVILLNSVCGRVDARGGLLFNPGILDLTKLGDHLLDRKAPLPGGVHPPARRILDDIPCTGLPDAIEQGRVRTLVVVAGNPVISFPNGRRFEQLFKKLDLFVALDPYMNETTRHAHYILPPPSMIERSDCVILNSSFLTKPYVQYTDAVCAAPSEVRSEWWFAREIAKRLPALPLREPNATFLRKLHLLRHRYTSRFTLALGERNVLKLMLRVFGKISLRKLQQNPHGLALGQLSPGELIKRLRTPNRKIQLFPPEIEICLSADATDPTLQIDGAFPLSLITRRRRGGMNSWLNRLHSSQAVDSHAVIEISAGDAEIYQIKSGESVAIESRSGSFVATANISDRVPRGIVTAPHSFVSELDHSHFNDAVGGERTDPLTGMPAFNGTKVRICTPGVRHLN